MYFNAETIENAAIFLTEPCERKQGLAAQFSNYDIIPISGISHLPDKKILAMSKLALQKSCRLLQFLESQH